MSTIIVMGAGPAGVATAVGLRRLGYNVMLISKPRRFAAIEGVSLRVINALQQQGFHHALKVVNDFGWRSVSWGDATTQQQNKEWLIDRLAFDNALCLDAEQHGVQLKEGLITKVEFVQGAWQVSMDNNTVETANFIVEARGRGAPLVKENSIKGPQTISILNRWNIEPQAASETFIASSDDGWVWGAKLSSGIGYWQWSVDVEGQKLPNKKKLLELCKEKQERCPVTAGLFGSVPEDVDLHIRGATPILHGTLSGANWIRVGDAAMSVDALSGSGIFQSLSSALQAPFVINTLIRRPSRAHLASEFHYQRVSHLFFRFARMGRDFYHLEQRWPDQNFWQQRQAWPDELNSHIDVDWEKVVVEYKPVIKENYIALEEVVLTADQPLGIWHINGISLAPIVKNLKNGQSVKQVLQSHSKVNQLAIARWLQEQGAKLQS